MKNLLLPTLLLTLMLTFCKKKDDKPTPTPASTGSGTTTGSTTGSTTSGNVTPSNATSFYGILDITNSTSTYSGTTYSGQNASAYFMNAPFQYFSSANSVKVSAVYLGADSLTYSPFYKSYDLYNVLPGTNTWSVTGANGIANFSYAVSVTQPVMAAVTLPDSIYKTTSFTITVNNVSNIKTASFAIVDNSFLGVYAAPILAGNNTIVITPSNMSSLTAGDGYISVSLENSEAISVSGKDYKLARHTQVTKQIKIKP
jgi:hypothetical protein